MGSRRLVTVFLAFIPLVSFAASSSVQVKIDNRRTRRTATGPCAPFSEFPTLRRQLVNFAGTSRCGG